MKKIKLTLLLSFCLIIVCNAQEKSDTPKSTVPKFHIDEKLYNSDKELDRIAEGKKKVFLKDGQCSYYFDEELSKNVYITIEAIAEFEPYDSEFISIISQKFSLSNEEYLETFETCGHSFRFSIIIDEQGNILTYTPTFSDASIRRGNDITPTDRKIELIIKYIKGWKPAICNNKSVTSRRHFRIPTRWFQPRENNTKDIE